MAFTFGFYNSLNGDRSYDATQISSIFDGIIKDGVFMSIGSALIVTAGTGMTVIVGEGRAWFDHTWSLNTAPMPIELDQSDVLQDRIDTIVLEIDSTVSVRANRILKIKGQPSTNPVSPSLIWTSTKKQYPLCDIRVNRGSTSIIQANITNRVGTSDTPFVTGILETINIDSLIAQWQDQWTIWFNQETINAKADLEAFETEIMLWFEDIKDTLGEDAAVGLYNKITELANIVSQIPIVKVYTFNAVIIYAWEGNGPYTQTVSVPGILATDNPVVDLMLSSDIVTARLELESWEAISKIETANNSITVICLNNKPTAYPPTWMPIQLKVVR